MEAYIKSFSAFRTLRKLSVLSHEMVMDSLDADVSRMTVAGTDVTHKNTGDWLVFEGAVYRISAVTPQSDRTALTLAPPIKSFNRPLELAQQTADTTIGGFVKTALEANWAEGTDPTYSIPYLVVSNSDTTPYVAPEVDKNGCFRLSEYCLLMRKGYHIILTFENGGDVLRCKVRASSPASRQVSFDDGRSQLKSVSYSSGGVAKLTVLCDTDTGQKDENGDKITVRSRTEWYLSEAGEITQDVPEHRAAGDWDTIVITGKDDLQAKVIEKFAKNKNNHKLEFWSMLDLNVQDNCTFCVYGELLVSYISYKRKSSNDNRFYYKSGELATTATEKLRGVTK